jgi:hypothetical protein
MKIEFAPKPVPEITKYGMFLFCGFIYGLLFLYFFEARNTFKDLMILGEFGALGVSIIPAVSLMLLFYEILHRFIHDVLAVFLSILAAIPTSFLFILGFYHFLSQLF